MALEQYLKSKKEADQVNATATHRIYEAAVALGNSMISPERGLIDRNFLAETSKRQNFATVFYSTLTNTASAYMGIPPGQLDSFKSTQLTLGIFGIMPDQVREYLETHQTDFELAQFLADMTVRNQVYNFMQARVKDVAKAQLTLDDKDAVLGYKNIGDLIDGNKIASVDDLAALLDEVEQNGSLSKTFLQGKAYTKKK